MKVNFTIGYSQDSVFIQIGDEDAGVRIVDLSLTYEQFARAVGSRYLSNLEANVNTSGTVGKLQEHKTLFIPFTSSRVDKAFEKQVDIALAPHEVDGWKGRRENFSNFHMREGDTVKVQFHRWVDKEDTHDS